MSLLFRSLELHLWLRSHFVSSGRCFYRCPAAHPTGIRLHLPFTMPIKCRHPNGTTHGVSIFDGDVICDFCERIFDKTEATPLQVLHAKDDGVDIAYQASPNDLVWMLYLDDPSRSHVRQKPRNGPWLFPPGTALRMLPIPDAPGAISAPDSGCPPCYAESAQAPGASGFDVSETKPAPGLSREKGWLKPGDPPVGLSQGEPSASSGSHGADVSLDAIHADDPQRSAPAEEDRKQEATDEGAPESCEKKASFYLSV